MNVLGIDIGGSGIKGAPVDINKGVLLAERYRIPTPQPATPETVADVINKIIEHFSWKGIVGIGFPAAIHKGIVKNASNIDSSWIGVLVNDYLSKKTNCTVYVANDADAAGLAEINHGAGKKQKGVTLMLTIGTGIGTVLFTNGKIVPNTELGHLYFKGETVEKYAADSVRKMLDLSWKKWGCRFSEVLNYFESLFNPDLIILGGGVSKKFEKYQEYLDVETPIKPAELLNNAGIIGAAIFAFKQNGKKNKPQKM